MFLIHHNFLIFLILLCLTHFSNFFISLYKKYFKCLLDTNIRNQQFNYDKLKFYVDCGLLQTNKLFPYYYVLLCSTVHHYKIPLTLVCNKLTNKEHEFEITHQVQTIIWKRYKIGHIATEITRNICIVLKFIINHNFRKLQNI